MKKIFTLLFFIIVAFFAYNFLGNDLSVSEKYAKQEDYGNFYNSIEKEYKSGNEDAKHLVAGVLCQAIQKGNFEVVNLLLSKDKTIINFETKKGYRPLTCAVSNANDKIDLVMFRKLLSYKPELNYEISEWKDFTLLQAISVNSKLHNQTEAIKLLVENGADVNKYHYDDSDAGLSPLIGLYETNNFESFKYLLEKGAILPIGKNFDLLSNIATNYGSFVRSKLGDEYNLFKHPLSDEQKTVLQNYNFDEFHIKNMKYLSELDSHGLLIYSESSKRGLSHLALSFASLDLKDGMTLLLKNGLCHEDKEVCNDIAKRANLLKNYEIENMIKKEINNGKL